MDIYDPQKESCRVVSRFGKPNPRQISEEDQRREERDAWLEIRDGKPASGPSGQ